VVRERLRDRHKDDAKRDEGYRWKISSKPERRVSANSESCFGPSNVGEKTGTLARKVEKESNVDPPFSDPLVSVVQTPRIDRIN
jgi:hypothetical protein